MKRPLDSWFSRWDRVGDVRASWPERPRPRPLQLAVQSLEPRLALAAVAAAKVTSVAAPADGTYTAGDELVFTVAFARPVAVSGTPRLDLTIGAVSRAAVYTPQGSDATALRFRYVVQSGELDTDGIVTAKTISLAGGLIVGTATRQLAALGFKPPTTSRVLVDAVRPTVVAVAGPAASTSAAGAVLSFAVTMSEAVRVTGTPSLPIAIGGTVRDAVWTGKGNGSKVLTFAAVVRPGDAADGLRIAGPIKLPHGVTIRDAAGNHAVPAVSGRFPAVKVDAVAPAVTGFGKVMIEKNGFVTRVSLRVTFSEPVAVTGKPSIPFTLADNDRLLVYAAGSGTRVLTFAYNTARDEVPTADNVSCYPGVMLNGGAILDAAGNRAASLAMPTRLEFLGWEVAYDAAIGTVVGKLSTRDPDGLQDRFTYTFVSGTGATDNGRFRIDRDQLVVARPFDSTTKNACSVRVRAADAGGLFTEAVLTISVVPATGTVDGFSYALSSAGVAITHYSGPDGAVVIPTTIRGVPVTVIRGSAFYARSQITSVTIPATVTSIGNRAFEYATRLKSVIFLGNPPLLGRDSFGNVRATVIHPAGNAEWATYGTGTFGRLAVAGNDRVTRDGFVYRIDSSGITIMRYIGQGGAVTIPATIAGLPVTAIGMSAFYRDEEVTSVAIPAGVTSIGYTAFADCSRLTRPTIPAGVTSIGHSAFSGCRSLTTVTFLGDPPRLDGSPFFDTTAVAIYPAGRPAWAEYAGRNFDCLITQGDDDVDPAGFVCRNHSSGVTIVRYIGPDGAVTIPAEIAGLPVTAIGENAFHGRAGVTSVSIPEGVTSIGPLAFADCQALESIAISASVGYIGSCAFFFCRSLTSVTIPAGVAGFGDSVFNGCLNLTRVNFLGDPPRLGIDVFRNVTATVFYPAGSVAWWKYHGLPFGGQPTRASESS